MTEPHPLIVFLCRCLGAIGLIVAILYFVAL